MLAKKGERSHACGECENVFTRNEHLQRHKREVHGAIRNYECKSCGLTFAREYDWKQHIKLKHNMDVGLSQTYSHGVTSIPGPPTYLSGRQYSLASPILVESEASPGPSGYGMRSIPGQSTQQSSLGLSSLTELQYRLMIEEGLRKQLSPRTLIPAELQYRLASQDRYSQLGTTDTFSDQDTFSSKKEYSGIPAALLQDTPFTMLPEPTSLDDKRNLLVNLPLMPSKKEAISDHNRLLHTASEIRRTIHQLSYLSTQSTMAATISIDYPSQIALGLALSKPFEEYLETRQALFCGRAAKPKSDIDIDLVALEDCHRRMSRICLMIVYLQNTGFLRTDLTVLIQQTRFAQVADLISVDTTRIAGLAIGFDRVLEACLEAASDESKGNLIQDLNRQCDDLWKSATSNERREKTSDTSIWYRTIDLLDLAICLHSEAHYVSTKPSEAYAFPFADHLKLRSGWICSARRTSCLDDLFRNHKLWVCSLSDTSEDIISPYSWEKTLPISIRTTIPTFNTVWGPVSQVKIDESIIQYNTGRGCIVPWSRDENSEVHSQGFEGKGRICHWMPFDLFETNCHAEAVAEERAVNLSNSVNENVFDQSSRCFASDNDSGDDDSSDIVGYEDLQPYSMPIEELRLRAEYAKNHPFDLEDVLVIGARKCPDTCLWQTECSCSSRESDILRTLTTQERTTSFTKGPIGVTLGVSGPGITASMKQDFTPITSHRYYTEMLISEWQHSRDYCHPKHLQVKGGVIISRCTRNAIRCSILDLFSTPSIKRLIQEFCILKGSKIEDEPWWHVFLYQTPDDILQTWDSHLEWRTHMGDIISKCLVQLSYSGLDLKRSCFSVLWMPPGGFRAKRVLLDINRHDWLNTLCEGPETCAMAVLIEDSLSIQIDGHREQFCTPGKRSRMRTVLQTAMAISDKLPPFAGKRLHRQYQEPKSHEAETGCDCYPLRLESGTFCAAPYRYFYRVDPLQRLLSVGSLSPDHLILQWCPSTLYDGVNTLRLNDLDGAGHREVFEDEEDALLVHIRHSKSPSHKSSHAVETPTENRLQKLAHWLF